MRCRLGWAALGAALASSTGAAAQPAPLTTTGFPRIQPSGITVSITPYFNVPADSATAPSARINYVVPEAGRLFTNDMAGQIYVTGPAGGTATPYLDMAAQGVPAVVNFPTGTGLAGFAFHPNFAGDPTTPGYGNFYTTGTVVNTAGAAANLGNGSGADMVQVREWHTASPLAPTFSGTSRVVMNVDGYTDGHSNSAIAFNPTAKPGSADYGNLYLGSGDGHYNDADQNAQNLGVPQGKMLRINPLQGPNGQPYTVPSDNPFVGQAGKLPEIYAYGLRFPQTFSWDRVTGAMYINDLGQDVVEEVNVGVAGANYGWSQREGMFATGYAYGLGSGDKNVYPIPVSSLGAGYTDPIAEFDHSEGDALGSGFVYRGSAIPALYGKYVMQDIVTGRIFVFDPAATPPGGQATLTELMLSQDGQPFVLDDAYGYNSQILKGPRVDARLSPDANGELLIAVKATGTVYELGPSTVPEPVALAVLLPALCLTVARRLKSAQAASAKA